MTSIEPTDTQTDAATADVAKLKLSSATVAKSIATLTAERTRANAEHKQLVLRRATGTIGLDTQIAELRQTRHDLADRLEELQMVHGAALNQERLAERAAKRNLTSMAIRSCRQHLSARNRNAAALTKAIEEAVAAYKSLVRAGEMVRKVSPTALEPGSLTSLGRIRQAIEHEIFRIGGDPSMEGNLTFPGGEPDTFAHTHNPGGIMSLADRIARDSAFLVAGWQKLLDAMDAKPVEPVAAPQAPQAPQAARASHPSATS